MSQGEPEHLLMRIEEGEAVPRRGDTEARSRPTLDSPLIYLQQVNSVSRSVLLRFGVGGILYPCQSYCSGPSSSFGLRRAVTPLLSSQSQLP